MAPQHDFILDNQSGAQFRADLNNALAAIAGFSSGPAEPTTTYAHQYWVDTLNNVLKQRDSSNASWYTLRSLDVSNGTAGQVLTSTGPTSAPSFQDIPGVITWSATPNTGNTAYNLDGPGLDGTEDNPTVVVFRGQTYKFTNETTLNPLRIQSTPGTAGTVYNDGVTNNGATEGTVLFEVPFDSPSVLYYQSSTTAALGGTIVVVGEPTVVGTRPANTHTTASLAADATEDYTITELGFAGIFFTIQTDTAAWVRFYTTAAARTADAARSITTDPSAGSGVLLEVVHTGAATTTITPSVNYFNGDTTPAEAIYVSVTNTDTVAATIQVDVVGIKLQ